MTRDSSGSGLRALAAASSIAAVLLASGCSGGARSVEVGDARPYVGPHFAIGADSGARFGFGPSRAPSGAPTASGTAAPPTDAFAFDLPDGWRRLEPSAMRAVDLRLDRDPSAECSLTLLGGDAGGLRANVDRWRKQMGLAPTTPSEFDALAPTSLLGRDAVAVDLVGSYAGMGGESRTGFRMLGRLAVAPGGSAFLKFTGPADVVEAEREAFERLADSLRVEPTDAGATTAGPGGPAVAATDGGELLRWTAPEGWVRGPARMMREVTYLTANGTVECYVSVLGGDGGGIRANFDRWRGQMGAAPLTDDELASLERVPCLGSSAILIAIDGDFEGMGGETSSGARMLGAVAAFEGRTVFVKLVGPRALAAAEEPNFRRFVASLESAR
ncbi:MAG: hypothetical protein R3F34_03510 [Planctomycetota bacterium]